MLKVVPGGETLRRVARLAAMRTVSLALALYAVGTDVLTRWHGMGFLQRGLLDEPAHLATCLVVFGAIIRFRRGDAPDPRFSWVLLACSVLIDVDHLPAEFGTNIVTSGTPRPYTHALWTVLVLTAAALVVRRRRAWRARSQQTPSSPGTAELVLGGAAAGIAAHFLRDIATAGMAFWWPVTDVSVQVPYWWYVLTLLVIIALPARRRNANADPPTGTAPAVSARHQTQASSSAHTQASLPSGSDLSVEVLKFSKKPARVCPALCYQASILWTVNAYSLHRPQRRGNACKACPQ